SPTTTSTRRIRPSALRRSTLVVGLVVGLVAAAVTTASAAVIHAAGVSFTVDCEMIPLAGFAQMTFLGAIIGGLILAVVNRLSSAPRRRFLEIAIALTALSCIPSV